MEQTIQEKVINTLTALPDLDEKIALLRYEMDHCVRVSPTEMIHAMSFSRGEGIGTAPGHISDKTLYTALNYEEKMRDINTEVFEPIVQKICQLEEERDRITHCISLLSPKQAQIVRLTFIDQKTTDQIADSMEISSKTVIRQRKCAIDRLCNMYTFIAGLR